MKACIISDMHCKYLQNPNENLDTFLISNRPRTPISRHPVIALLHLIEKEHITADVLICPGDLGDKSDEQGIISAWGFLEEIKEKLGAKLLIGIPGNHDINSRKNDQKEPFQFIKVFHPGFPVEDEKLKALFWDNAYCFLKKDETLYLLFNSVHDHTDEKKANQSCILPETLEGIERAFENDPDYDKCPYKIAILHHHPIHHSNINNWKDTDLIDKGDELVKLLNRLKFQILIHGHKHQPRIVEYNSLPIFACGSFSSFANLRGTGINNMFHLINLQENSKKGFIHSWEYDILNGWEQKLNKNFPPIVGFGATQSPQDIAKKINEIFEQHNRKAILYDEITVEVEDVKYLIPEKLIILNDLLNDTYNIKVTPEFPLEPSKVSELLIKR